MKIGVCVGVLGDLRGRIVPEFLLDIPGRHLEREYPRINDEEALFSPFKLEGTFLTWAGSPSMPW
jgi:hypothetical protein